ncbi:Smr/MutS family protein [Salinispira pacifica]
MSFGDVLSQWEEERRRRDAAEKSETPANGPKPRSNSMEDWLERYPPPSGHDGERTVEEAQQDRSNADSRAWLRMAHQAEIDLHGLRAEEALNRLDQFLLECERSGLRKVLVIHGKGIHSDRGEAVLARAVRLHLQKHTLAGKLVHPPRQYGGRGALWVMLRMEKKNQRSR